MFSTGKRYRLLMLLLIILSVFALTVSTGLGRYAIDPLTIIKMLIGKLIPNGFTASKEAESVLFNIRLPRVLFGMLVGAGLSVAGMSYQSIFQNPLVSPDVLGASGGAAFGAALGIFFGVGYVLTTALSFVLGLLAVLIVSVIASRVKHNRTLGLILSGMMISTLCTSAISYIKLMADPMNQLPAITYWLMGSLASIRWSDALSAAPVIVVGITGIIILSWKINLLSSGDEEAAALGVNVPLIRGAAIALATLITSACVSVSGLIGWVGLVIPHFARILAGADASRSIPVSAILGGLFMLLTDNIARLATTGEIPIGILTAFVGAPVFLILIVRGDRA